MWMAMGARFNRYRKGLGLPPQGGFWFDFLPIFHMYSPSVGPCPADWPPHASTCGWLAASASTSTASEAPTAAAVAATTSGEGSEATQITSFRPPQTLVDFLASAKDGGVPVVYIGFGSMPLSSASALITASAGALKQLGFRGLFYLKEGIGATSATGAEEGGTTALPTSAQHPMPPTVHTTNTNPTNPPTHQRYGPPPRLPGSPARMALPPMPGGSAPWGRRHGRGCETIHTPYHTIPYTPCNAVEWDSMPPPHNHTAIIPYDTTDRRFDPRGDPYRDLSTAGRSTLLGRAMRDSWCRPPDSGITPRHAAQRCTTPSRAVPPCHVPKATRRHATTRHE